MGDTGTWRRVREGTRQRREGRAGAEHEGPHARRHWCALLWSHTGPSPGCSANRSLSRAIRAALWYGEERAGGRRAGGASDS